MIKYKKKGKKYVPVNLSLCKHGLCRKDGSKCWKCDRDAIRRTYPTVEEVAIGINSWFKGDEN